MSDPQADVPWWRDIRAVMELVALLAVAAAIGVSTWRNKLEPTQAILLLTGSLATITAAVNRRGQGPTPPESGP